VNYSFKCLINFQFQTFVTQAKLCPIRANYMSTFLDFSTMSIARQRNTERKIKAVWAILGQEAIQSKHKLLMYETRVLVAIK